MEDLIAALSGGPFERSWRIVDKALDNWRFKEHAMGKRHGDFPVAVLKRDQIAQMQVKSSVLRLSSDTARRKSRPETHGGHGLVPEDYRGVQKFLDGGGLFPLQRKRHFGFLGKSPDGKLWYGVVKVTGDGERLYLQSLRRTNTEDIRRQIRKAER